MRHLIILTASGLLAASAGAQTPGPKAVGTWTVEYDHAVVRLHGETTSRHEHGQMTLRSVGDSLFGELIIGDSASADRSALRGIARREVWTVYVEDPAARGKGIFFSAVGSMIDWLRETVHGIQPVVVRFDVSARGDSLTGTRLVTGGMSRGRRTSTVTGKRTSR